MAGSALVGKVCSMCKEWKDASWYRERRVDGSTYLTSKCNPCAVDYTKRWRGGNVLKMLLSGCKSRAKRFGLAFDLSEEDIKIPETCPVLGISLSTQGGGRTDYSPTVDRILPHLGYTKDNIAVISWRANRLKSDASPDELMKLALYAKETH